jgi:hypothetical protein
MHILKVGAKLSSFSIALGISLLMSGCQKITDSFSTTPAITFKSYSIQKLVDSSGNPDYKLVLTISFTDGDGDIGLGQGDTTGNFSPEKPWYNNLLVNYYEKVHGTFIRMYLSYPYPSNGHDTVKYDGRIPNITPAGRNKAIKGDIDYSIDLGSGSKTGNSIKFDFVLYDRALHRSNLTESPEIALP